jgi:hypothetical protein
MIFFFRMHLLLGGQTSGITRLGWGQYSGICPIFGGVKPPEWWGQTKMEWWGQRCRNTHIYIVALLFIAISDQPLVRCATLTTPTHPLRGSFRQMSTGHLVFANTKTALHESLMWFLFVRSNFCSPAYFRPSVTGNALTAY